MCHRESIRDRDLISKGLKETYIALDKDYPSTNSYEEIDYSVITIDKINNLFRNSDYCIFILFHDGNNSVIGELGEYLKNYYSNELKKRTLICILGIIKKYEINIFIHDILILKERLGMKNSSNTSKFTFKFHGVEIPVFEDDYTSGNRHQTPNYYKALAVIRKEKIEQKPIEDTLKWYFEDYSNINDKEKRTVQEIRYCIKTRILVMRMGYGNHTFNARIDIARKTGWYFYITGTDLPFHEMSNFADAISRKKRFTIDSFKIEVQESSVQSDKDPQFELENIASEADQNCFMLKFADKRFLLDAGCYIDKLESYFDDRGIKNLEGIFISHIHKDHSRSAVNLLEKFPDTPLFMSASTLDFLLILTDKKAKRKKGSGSDRVNSAHDTELILEKLVKNTCIVKNNDSINIVKTRGSQGSIKTQDSQGSQGSRKSPRFESNNAEQMSGSEKENRNKTENTVDDSGNPIGYVKFLFAGHTFGALMIFVEFNSRKFLYTGDFSFESYRPIPGIDTIFSELPSNLDYLLVDSSHISSEFRPFEEQKRLLQKISLQTARSKNDVLIAADTFSAGPIFFILLHQYFIFLKNNRSFNNRPNIFLNQEILECAQVIINRIADVHPSIARNIKKELNPFSSAMIRWLKNAYDYDKLLENLIKKKRYKGNIIIIDSSSIDYQTFRLFKEISSKKENFIYISGRLENQGLIELISGSNIGSSSDSNGSSSSGSNGGSNNGSNDYYLDYYDYKSGQKKGETIRNNAEVVNQTDPNSIIVLHGDSVQFFRLMNKTRPSRIGFFHVNPMKVAEMGNMVNNFKFVISTDVYYKDKRTTINF